MNPLASDWDRVKLLLRQAEGALRANSNGSPIASEAFEEFMQHNELELAWDELTAIATQADTARECWKSLAEAAELMKLPGKQAEARRHLQDSATAVQ